MVERFLLLTDMDETFQRSFASNPNRLVMQNSGFFTVRKSGALLSDYLTDRSKVKQNKINFVKNCPQWGLNLQPPDHYSNSLPTDLDLGRNLLDRRFLK